MPTFPAAVAATPLKILNRCAVSVEPRQPFIDWAKQVEPDQALPPGAFEPGLYLLPEYETREEAIGLLEQGYEEIFCAELEAWSTDPATWPCSRSGSPFDSLIWSATRGRSPWSTTRRTNPSWKICAA